MYAFPLGNHRSTCIVNSTITAQKKTFGLGWLDELGGPVCLIFQFSVGYMQGQIDACVARKGKTYGSSLLVDLCFAVRKVLCNVLVCRSRSNALFTKGEKGKTAIITYPICQQTGKNYLLLTRSQYKNVYRLFSGKEQSTFFILLSHVVQQIYTSISFQFF